MFEDVGEMIGSMGIGVDAVRGPLDDLAASWRRLSENIVATVVAGKQGRDSLGHFTEASKGLSIDAKGAASAIASIGTTATALATGAIPSATQAFSALGGALSSGITSATSDAAAGLAKLGPEGAVAGAALEAVGTIAAATVGTLTTLVGVTIQVSEQLGLMGARTAALAGSAAAGAAVTHLVDRLSAQLPFATAQISEWSQNLIKAGVAGRDLERATRAIASAEAIGPGGAAAAQNLISKLAAGGKETTSFLKSIQEGGGRANKILRGAGIEMQDIGGKAAIAKMNAAQLNAAIQQALVAKGAGPLEKMNVSFGNILEKAQEGFRSLFSGVDIGPLMTSIQSLFGEFNKGGDATNSMKPIVTSVLNDVFDLATKATVAVHDMIDGFMGTKDAKGPFVEIGKVVRNVTDTIVDLASNKQLITGVEVVLLGVGGAVVALGVGIAAVAGGITTAIGWVAEQFAELPQVADDMVTLVIAPLMRLGTGAMDAASSIISGLVDGITGGVGRVVSAMKGLAESAIAAFRGPPQIHSPSRVMKRDGKDHLAGGLAEGVDEGRPRVRNAMRRLGVDASTMGERPSGGVAGLRGKIAEKIEIIFHGAARDFPAFREQAQAWLDGLASGDAGALPEGG